MSINSGVINGFTINGAGFAVAEAPGVVILAAVSSVVTNIIATLQAPGLAAIALPMASAQIGLKQQTKSTCSLTVPTWDQVDDIEARRINGTVLLTATFSRDGAEYDAYEIGIFDVDGIKATLEANDAFININASRSIIFDAPKVRQFDYWTSYNNTQQGVQLESASVDFSLAPLDTVTSFNTVDVIVIDEVSFSLQPDLARMSMKQNFSEPVISA